MLTGSSRGGLTSAMVVLLTVRAAGQRHTVRVAPLPCPHTSAERNEEIKSTRLDLPWVPAGKEIRVRHRGRQEDPRRPVRAGGHNARRCDGIPQSPCPCCGG